MEFNLNELPDYIKLEVSKEDLLAFANALAQEMASMEKLAGASPETECETLDFQEMIRFLKLERSTGYQKVQDGEIPHYKVGRRLLFKKHELLAYLDSKKVKTKKDLEVIAQEYLKKPKNGSRG